MSRRRLFFCFYLLTLARRQTHSEERRSRGEQEWRREKSRERRRQRSTFHCVVYACMLFGSFPDILFFFPSSHCFVRSEQKVRTSSVDIFSVLHYRVHFSLDKVIRVSIRWHKKTNQSTMIIHLISTRYIFQYSINFISSRLYLEKFVFYRIVLLSAQNDLIFLLSIVFRSSLVQTELDSSIGSIAIGRDETRPRTFLSIRIL